MKYIIEIAKEYEEYFKGILICGIAEGKFAVDVIAKEDLEELNSDYINEHYGDLQDTAYKKGLHDGESKCRYCNEYQRGLDDAWEAARKVGHCKLWDDYTKDTGKPSVCAVAVLDRYTASEAIEKLKAYEEKKSDDEIKVGDEVERSVYGRAEGKGIYLEDADEEGDWLKCLFWTGATFTVLAYPKEQFKKTGRHFNISSILKEMQS